MYNKFMAEKEINVKVGDRVKVQGYMGTVLEVKKGFNKEWNGTEYVKVAETDFTNVVVHFDESQDIAKFGQYQNGEYGGYTVIR